MQELNTSSGAPRYLGDFGALIIAVFTSDLVCSVRSFSAAPDERRCSPALSFNATLLIQELLPEMKGISQEQENLGDFHRETWGLQWIKTAFLLLPLVSKAQLCWSASDPRVLLLDIPLP